MSWRTKQRRQVARAKARVLARAKALQSYPATPAWVQGTVSGRMSSRHASMSQISRAWLPPELKAVHDSIERLALAVGDSRTVDSMRTHRAFRDLTGWRAGSYFGGLGDLGYGKTT